MVSRRKLPLESHEPPVLTISRHARLFPLDDIYQLEYTLPLYKDDTEAMKILSMYENGMADWVQDGFSRSQIATLVKCCAPFCRLALDSYRNAKAIDDRRSANMQVI